MLALLQSLSRNTHNPNNNEEASNYIDCFQREKSQLLRKLYAYFNLTVFNNELPEDLELEFNTRLVSTGGQFIYYVQVVTKTISQLSQKKGPISFENQHFSKIQPPTEPRNGY